METLMLIVVVVVALAIVAASTATTIAVWRLTDRVAEMAALFRTEANIRQRTQSDRLADHG